MIPKTGNKQADTALLIIILAAVAYLVYKLTKVVGAGAGAIQDVIEDPFGTEDENAQLQNQIQVDESKLTYPKDQYATWAQAIEIAILSDPYEDEAAVDSIIWQIQNDEDLGQLIKAFGVRKDWYFGALPGPTYNLTSAITHFMPERVNDYNNHFAGWNMRRRF
jgi:hypothetical protein